MRDESPPWLPDLCRIPRLAFVLAAAELVVVAVALTSLQERRFDPNAFIVASALALWIALASAIVLCQLRVAISRLPRFLGMAAALALPMAVAAFFVWTTQLLSLHELLSAAPGGIGSGDVAGISLLTGIIAAIVLRYFYVIEQWRLQIEANSRAALDALQARIRPHFLFNSMNTIASLVRTDPVLAERAVEDLSDLFRAALSAGDRDTSLAEELELSRRYLDIESLRLGDRLAVEWRVEPDVPLDFRLPALVLQPLVENAVNHGISRLPKGGRILVQVGVDAGGIRVWVRNPMPAQGGGPNNGHAQASIARRLTYYFGPAAWLEAGPGAGEYVCEMLLPLTGGKPA